MTRPAAGRPWDAAAGAAVFAIGCAAALACARRGLAPYDASIVFDGGWRLLQGQVPFRDFLAPFGAVPFALQAVFFALFGVGWTAVALHAALLNGAFGLVVLALLRGRGAPRWLAFLLAALSTLLFTPPFGMVHAEHHAFLFSLAALLAAERPARSRRALPALAIPPLAALALLSKQIPSAFLLPLVALPLARVPAGRVAPLAKRLAASAAVTVAALAGFAFALGIPAQDLRLSLLTLPAGAGGPRVARLLPHLAALTPAAAAVGAGASALALVSGWAALALRAVSLWTLPYGTFLLVPAIAVAAALAPRLPWRPRAGAALLLVAAAASALVFPAVLFVLPALALAAAGGLLVAGGGRPAAWRTAAAAAAAAFLALLHFRLWTRHEALAVEAVGLGLLLAAAATGQDARASRRLARGATLGALLLAATLLFALVTNQEPQGAAPVLFLAAGVAAAPLARRPRAGAAALLALVAATAAIDAARFQRAVNEPRVLFFRTPYVADDAPAGALPPPLRFLRLQRGAPASAADLAAFHRFFREHPESFLILGESRYLYGTTRRPSPDPALWDHAGLSYPPPGTPEFDRFARRLRRALRAHAVRWVVVESTRDPDPRIAALPWLRAAAAGPLAAHIGPFAIHDARGAF